jgi:hypothetical protein
VGWHTANSASLGQNAKFLGRSRPIPAGKGRGWAGVLNPGLGRLPATPAGPKRCGAQLGQRIADPGWAGLPPAPAGPLPRRGWAGLSSSPGWAIAPAPRRVNPSPQPAGLGQEIQSGWAPVSQPVLPGQRGKRVWIVPSLRSTSDCSASFPGKHLRDYDLSRVSIK